MAYEIRNKNGKGIKKDGKSLMVANSLDVKISDLDEKNKSFIAVASDENPDRDDDVIRQSGWKLANFRKNPVMPWSHDYYTIPIGKSLKTWIDNDHAKGPRLMFQPQFDETDDIAMKIFNKYKNGYMTSFSVGFIGIDFKWRDEEEKWWGGREFTKQELLEISPVTVPANPGASTRLSYVGEDIPDNMLQMGYPEVFAKTESGLFYPVNDVATFCVPKEAEVDEGVTAIFAKHLGTDEDSTIPVAYIFDQKKYDDKTANEWIDINVEKTCKTIYYDINFNEEKGMFDLSENQEDSEIKRFEKSIEHEVTSVEESRSELVDLNDQTVDDGTKGTKNEDSTDENSNEGTKSENSENDDPMFISAKQTIETVITIKNAKGEVIDQHTETIATNADFKSVNEYLEFNTKNNEVAFEKKIENIETKFNTKLEERFANFEKSLLESVSQKTVANEDTMPDNENNSSKSDSNDDEFIELDESLIKSPGDDTNDSDEFIEIDERLFEESKSTISDTIGSAVSEKLKAALQEALNDASGKID